jgi:autotransporter-associated beta strand protein
MAVTGVSLEITNVISGAGGLTKTGSGLLELNSVNTYTGATSIDAGSLILAAGASISGSERVTVGANGIFDTSAITDNVYIKSLAGAGDVINGSTAPNSLVITNGIPGDVFSGVISGSGGLRISGGTQTLTGANTYSGPTVVDAGANLIAAIQSIPGDIVNNGSFGFNQATAGIFSHDMSGSGVMAISGSGVITLTGTNTQAGGTRLDPGASVMIGSVDALSGNTLNSNNGSFGIASNIVLSSLDITGSVTLTTDISTTGPQSYNNIRLAPSSDNVTTLETVNSDITITGTIDGTVSKMQSIAVNAGTGKVTLGDSIGSIAMPNTLTITGSQIYILADILTGDKQEYNGAIFIGSGSYIGKAFVRGFLFDSHSQYFEYAQSGASSTISYLNNDPRYVRTLVSKDPIVTFNGTVNDVSDFTHTLLVAAIAADATSALVSATMPIVNFNDSVSQTIPLYSLNVQTIAALANTNTPDLSVYVGVINIAGDIATFSNQTFRTASIPALSGSQPISFSVYDPNASIAFRLPPDASTVVSNPNIVINGQTNLGNFASGFTQNAALGYTINLPASAYGDPFALANRPFPDFNSGLNGLPFNTTQPGNQFASFELANKLADGGAIRGLADYQAELIKMSATSSSRTGVSVSAPESIEIQSDKPGAGKSNTSKSVGTEICTTDASGNTECEEI